MKNSCAIGIKDLQISCIIGCLPEERQHPQILQIDIRLHMPVPSTDKLSDTVDYTAVAKLIAEIATRGSYFLIETLAQEIAKAVLGNFLLINKLILLIKKPNAIENAACSFVEFEYER